MSSYTKELLSGSTNGRPIPVAATATPGTTIHTAPAGTSSLDEVYLFVSNVTAATVRLTVEFGGVSDPGDHMVKSLSVPAYSPPIPIATGQPVQNSVVVKAFGSTASALNITGFVNRIIL
jgi:hypothetical protein